MDTDLLKTFLEVQRTRHFGKAAENLYLTQSAVSFRIRQLEQQLGVNLFVRYRNNIQLTAAGSRLLPHAQTMLDALQRARHDVASSAQHIQQLALGAQTALWESALMPAFFAMQAAKPALHWRTDSLNREQLTRQLLEHQLDLALLLDQPKSEEISSTKLAEITLLPVSSCPNQIASGKLASPYCYVDWGSAFELQHSRYFAEQQTVVLRTSSAALALAWLKQHSASAYLPSALAHTAIKEGMITILSDTPVIVRELYAAHLIDHQYHQELAAVISLLQQHFVKAEQHA